MFSRPMDQPVQFVAKSPLFQTAVRRPKILTVHRAAGCSPLVRRIAVLDRKPRVVMFDCTLNRFNLIGCCN